MDALHGEFEVDAEDQVAAMQALDSDGASELVVGREKMSNKHDRELTAPVQVLTAMQAVSSAVAGASELVVGREKMSNKHDRELAAPVQVLTAMHSALHFRTCETR